MTKNILFCTSSLPRNFSLAFQSLKHSILDKLPARPYFLGHFPEIDIDSQKTIYDAFSSSSKDMILSFEKDPEIDPNLLVDYSKNVDSGAMTSGLKGILLQWYSLRNLKILLRQASYKWGLRADDIVIWARPDLFYFNHLDYSKITKRIYQDNILFPCHDHHLGGINDRFCIGSYKMMDIRFGIYDYFIYEWYSKRHFIKTWNPEIVLRDMLEDRKISVDYINITFGKLRNNHVSKPLWNIRTLLAHKKWRCLLGIPFDIFYKIHRQKFHHFKGENISGLPINTALVFLKNKI